MERKRAHSMSSWAWNILPLFVQSLSHAGLFVTLWTAARQSPLSSTISQNLLKFMSIELVMRSHHLILCHPLLLLPSIFPSVSEPSFQSDAGSACSVSNHSQDGSEEQSFLCVGSSGLLSAAPHEAQCECSYRQGQARSCFSRS